MGAPHILCSDADNQGKLLTSPSDRSNRKGSSRPEEE